ncbi:MAG: anaerobic ribonucleoside-triphosphate reductase activating protein [Dorea sp.]|nr:anaerobic ribonucleoside-triphosphate reductase activating protein [Dorea sp.]
MYYAEIKKCDIANGLGVRTSLFVSGCRHHCKGCFNEVAWDFEYGKPYTEEVQEEILKSMAPPYIAGLSLLGGEPFEPENQEPLLGLLREFRKTYPKKNVWCYTGFIYEKDLVEGGRAYTPFTKEMLSLIDVLVDGPFVEELKDITLKFRGSSNQRVLELHKMR